MKIKIVNVLVQFEVVEATEAQCKALDDFIVEEEHGDTSDNPVYEGVNAIVSSVLKNGKRLGLDMANTMTPQTDFDIDVTMRVVAK